MTDDQLTIVILRLVVPLLILRYPLVGGVTAMVLDALDVVLIDLIGGGFTGIYSRVDKSLDLYYLSLEFLVALRWVSPYARWPAIGLFVYRAIGVIAFEITQQRVILFAFPNQFESWWLYCVVTARFWPHLYPHSWRSVLVPMALLLAPKMGQEYLLHYREAAPWTRMKRNVLGV